jgi:hypothetical protein
MKLLGVSVMANANHIAGAVESVSLHLESVRLLAETLSGVIEDGGSRSHQYAFCLAFELLAEAAQRHLETVHGGVQQLLPLKRDMDALSRQVSRA